MTFGVYHVLAKYVFPMKGQLETLVWPGGFPLLWMAWSCLVDVPLAPENGIWAHTANFHCVNDSQVCLQWDTWENIAGWTAAVDETESNHVAVSSASDADGVKVGGIHACKDVGSD